MVKEPVRILEFEVKQLRNKDISMVKVLWKHHSQGEATWEKQRHGCERGIHSFLRVQVWNFGDKIL